MLTTTTMIEEESKNKMNVSTSTSSHMDHRDLSRLTDTKSPLTTTTTSTNTLEAFTTAQRIALLHSNIEGGIYSITSLWRPTEAQLRWAQFHFKTRAKNTQLKVEKLLQFPQNVKDVPFATVSDGESSSSGIISDSGDDQSDCSCEGRATSGIKKKSKSNKKKKKRMKISKGRRALLNVSKRAYEFRKHRMEDSKNFNNTSMTITDEASLADTSYCLSLSAHSHSNNMRRSGGHHHTTRIVKGTNRPTVLFHGRYNDDIDFEDRIKRFEDAYHILNERAHNTNNTNNFNDDSDLRSINTSYTAKNKRWTRRGVSNSPKILQGKTFNNNYNNNENSFRNSPSSTPSPPMKKKKNLIVYRNNFVFTVSKVNDMRNSFGSFLSNKINHINTGNGENTNTNMNMNMNDNGINKMMNKIKTKLPHHNHHQHHSTRSNNSNKNVHILNTLQQQQQKNQNQDETRNLLQQYHLKRNSKQSNNSSIDEQHTNFIDSSPITGIRSFFNNSNNTNNDQDKGNSSSHNHHQRHPSKANFSESDGTISSLSVRELSSQVLKSIVQRGRNSSTSSSGGLHHHTNSYTTIIDTDDYYDNAINLSSSLGGGENASFLSLNTTTYNDSSNHTNNNNNKASSQVTTQTTQSTSTRTSNTNSQISLSPTVLSKRHQQAIDSIKTQNWDDLLYLLNANPWLAEMTDGLTGQVLLHHMAQHYSSPSSSSSSSHTQHDTNTKKLYKYLYSLHKDAIYKFDKQGNLPLHMCAKSGKSLEMLKFLSLKFKEGSSVRNYNGHLPLHLAVLSRNFKSVKYLNRLFPKGVSVTDNDRMLPLHFAASIGNSTESLENDDINNNNNDDSGAAAAEIVYELLQYDNGIKRRVAKSLDENGEMEIETMRIPSIMATNKYGKTPLELCLCLDKHKGRRKEEEENKKSKIDCQILEALLSADKAHDAVLSQEEKHNGNNMLHRLLMMPSQTLSSSSNNNDDSANDLLAAIFTILKVVPSIVTTKNQDGISPIELACMNNLSREVLLGIILIDLPIDLDNTESPKISTTNPKLGFSWWFIVCDTDDMYVSLVEEVLSICNYKQRKLLCFLKRGGGANNTTTITTTNTTNNNNKKAPSLMTCATPKCKAILRKSLRFDGRYEFIKVKLKNEEFGLTVFDALDFYEVSQNNNVGVGGSEDSTTTTQHPNKQMMKKEGEKVYLQCFSNSQQFENEIEVLSQISSFVNTNYVEKTRFFVCDSDYADYLEHRVQYCIAIEKPSMTLSKYIQKIPLLIEKEEKGSSGSGSKENKIRPILHSIAVAIMHIHTDLHIVHGDISLKNCGKFSTINNGEDVWKLMDISNSTFIGDVMSVDKMGDYSPPECCLCRRLHNSMNNNKDEEEGMLVEFRDDFIADVSMDVWAFGLLLYESLIQEPKLFTRSNLNHDNDEFMQELSQWSLQNVENISIQQQQNNNETTEERKELSSSSSSFLLVVTDLICQCLAPDPENRPRDFETILKHKFWQLF